jgi:hypothetical protein
VYVDDKDDSSWLLGPGKPIATELFKRVGVRLTWHEGEVPTGQFGLMIRTAERAPTSASGEALAATRILGLTREIIVYKDRLESFLELHSSLRKVARAYVLTHELAHAMQGIGRHSDSGVMKAHWSDQDFQEMVFLKLGFAPPDVELIHKGLAADTGLSIQATVPHGR